MREKQAANLPPKPLRVIVGQAQQIIGLQAWQHRFAVVIHDGQHMVLEYTSMSAQSVMVGPVAT